MLSVRPSPAAMSAPMTRPPTRCASWLTPALADGSADLLTDALRTLLKRSAPGVHTALRVEGTARAIPESLAGAVLHTARGALANVFEHARSSRAVLTLTYLPDVLILDIRDDGVGFDPTSSAQRGSRGHGLPVANAAAQQHCPPESLDGA